MNLSHLWKILRPGLMIPVFFLSNCQACGQFSTQETSVAACGGAFVSRCGFNNSISNQAGLGWINQRCLSIQHARPFILAELGVSSISVQLPAGAGAIGASLTCFGIKGLYRTSGWISYGMKLHPDVTAGAGIHFRVSTIPEKTVFHPGVSCALGIQVRITNQLIAGGHVRYPAGWAADLPGRQNLPMILTAGCSYTFFKTATYHADLHIIAKDKPQLSHGIELKIQDRFGVLFGMHNHPYATSFGIAFTTSQWSIQIAFESLVDTGSVPSSSLTYEW